MAYRPWDHHRLECSYLYHHREAIGRAAETWVVCHMKMVRAHNHPHLELCLWQQDSLDHMGEALSSRHWVGQEADGHRSRVRHRQGGELGLYEVDSHLGPQQLWAGVAQANNI